VPRFIRQALLGDPITVYDNGEQTRCWTYIDDAVDGLIALAQSAEAAAGEIVNLGSNFESSIKDLAIKIKEQTNSDSEIAFIPFSETRRNGLYEDLVYRAPDLEKIRTLVGYDPKVDLDEALRRIIEDFKK